jgi:hypothetical protein
MCNAIDEERRILARSRTRTDMVWLDLRLVNWSHADHSLLLDLDTPLSSLARRIQVQSSYTDGHMLNAS